MADPSKVHYANYEGRWIKTRGPLSIPRSPQGHPVIMQAGSSDRGREFAARWAEVIFTIQRGKAEMARVLRRHQAPAWQAHRPRPAECAILPGVIGGAGRDRVDRARAGGLPRQPDRSGTESSPRPPAASAPTSPSCKAGAPSAGRAAGQPGHAGHRGRAGAAHEGRGRHLQGGRSRSAAAGREIVGTAEPWSPTVCRSCSRPGVCDGFVLAPTMFPGMFEQFCRSVVPELQRRGLFRTEYTGTHAARKPAG